MVDLVPSLFVFVTLAAAALNLYASVWRQAIRIAQSLLRHTAVNLAPRELASILLTPLQEILLDMENWPQEVTAFLVLVRLLWTMLPFCICVVFAPGHILDIQYV